MATIKERKSFIIMWGFIGIFLFISCAQAQQPTAAYLDERIDNQSKRIDQGVRAGHFTRDESRILIDNLDYIRNQEARFKASGGFTTAEQQQLNGLLDQNIRMIGKQKPVETLRPGIDSHGIAASAKEGSVKEAATAAMGKAAASIPGAEKLFSGKKININTATKEELDALPGIGSVKAQAIVDGRPYKKTEDIMKVKGIKQGDFDKIKDLITVK